MLVQYGGDGDHEGVWCEVSEFEAVVAVEGRRIAVECIDGDRSHRQLHRMRQRPGRATVRSEVTAKEKLRERIEALSEQEAGEALRLLDMRADPVIAAFRDARRTMTPGLRKTRRLLRKAERTSLLDARSRWMRCCETLSERRCLAR